MEDGNGKKIGARKHQHQGSETLLIGIILHKIPESFALVAVLLTRLSKLKTFLLLVVFALASPLGMVSTELLYHQNLIGREFINILFGLVAGGLSSYFHHDFFRKQPTAQIPVSQAGDHLIRSGFGDIVGVRDLAYGW